MPEAAAGEFILFQTGEAGPDIASAAAQVASAPGFVLLRRNPSVLLVRGTLDAVQGLLLVLNGWQAEPDTRVRAGV